MISYTETTKLIKEKQDYYNALLRNGYRVPAFKSPIMSR